MKCVICNPLLLMCDFYRLVSIHDETVRIFKTITCSRVRCPVLSTALFSSEMMAKEWRAPFFVTTNMDFTYVNRKCNSMVQSDYG